MYYLRLVLLYRILSFIESQLSIFHLYQFGRCGTTPEHCSNPNNAWLANEPWFPITQATTTTEATTLTNTTSSEATEASANEIITTVFWTASANETTSTAATSATIESTVVNCTEEGTPEENYYELYWEELPAAIQEAYGVFGYTQEIWDEGEEMATDGWNDLSQEILDAALCIGYTGDDWPAGMGTISNTTEAVANNTTTFVTNGNTTDQLDSPSDSFNYTSPTYSPMNDTWPTYSPNEQANVDSAAAAEEPSSGALPKNALLRGIASLLVVGTWLFIC